MATNIWLPFNNFILSATTKSYEKAQKVSTYHDTALLADSTTDPFILGLYNFYHPFHLALVKAMTDWIAQGGTQQGTTQTFTELIDGLPAQADEWDYDIRAVYKKGTTQYTTLFPHAHKPFYSGSQQDKVNAVAALITAIGSDAALAAVKATIQTYYDQLTVAAVNKDTNKDNTSTNSDAVEAARVAMCNAQFKNYGDLMSHFYDAPEKAMKYFDEHNLRVQQQSLFTSSILRPLTFAFICKRTLKNGQTLLFTNNSDKPIRFYLADRKDAPIGTIFIEIPAHTQQEHAINDLGDYTTLHYLLVYNPDASVTAAWEVEIE